MDSLMLRKEEESLPTNVSYLQCDDGTHVYLVGTAHFSEESNEDVARTIRLVKPHCVVLELCPARIGILDAVENSDDSNEDANSDSDVSKEEKLSLSKLLMMICNSEGTQRIAHYVLSTLSGSIGRSLELRPGGEFRVAVKEAAQLSHQCAVILGDRPIDITLKRTLYSLTWWQKLSMLWLIARSSFTVTQAEVEKMKLTITDVLNELQGEYPQLMMPLVRERDLFMTHVIRTQCRNPILQQHSRPLIVVGVVGIGHVPGIRENWTHDINVNALLEVPSCKPSVLRRASAIATIFFMGSISYIIYRRF